MAAVRASDTEREAVVETLRAHAGDGRLDADELEERVARALQARMCDDLEPLLADLPARRRQGSGSVGSGSVASLLLREHLRAYVLVNALLVAIWALTGFGYFWPVWPMLGWGVGLATHASCPRTRVRRTSDAY